MGQICGKVRPQDDSAAIVPPAPLKSGTSTDVADNTCPLCLGELKKQRMKLELASGTQTICKDCFVCCVDQEPLKGKFMEKEGQLYCMSHYAEKFCPICEGCSTRVTGKVISAMGASWHEECFACQLCRTPLGSSSNFSFHIHADNVYCKECFKENIADKCNGCGFPIVGESMTAMDKTWHRECFVCAECREPFSFMEDTAYRILDGYPYCIKDANALAGVSSEDRSRLRASVVASNPSVQAAPDTRNTFTADERGACLSEGITEMLNSLKKEKQSLEKGDYVATQQSKIDGKIASFHIESVAPEVFKKLRNNAFGVPEDEFLRSISLRPLSGGGKGEGKSGQLFFFSWDKRFIVKTIDHVEKPFFKKCVQDYYNHFCGKDAPHDDAGVTLSLLPRYLGVYSMKLEGVSAINVLVMVNVFPRDLEFKEMYDIKGVLGSARFVSKEEQAAGTKVLKDRNFNTRSVNIGHELKSRLLEQFHRDTEFLWMHNRIDYSLLLGVATLDAVHEEPNKNTIKQWPTPERQGIQSAGGEKEVFFLGIIDVLQEYTMKKMAENAVKGLKFEVDQMTKYNSGVATRDNAVSAVNASHYAMRFCTYIASKLE